MKTLFHASILVTFFFSVTSISAQTLVKVVRGSLEPLKGEKNINIEFTYDNMMVGAELTEANFVTRKKNEYNEKQEGLGDKWERTWFGNRRDLFEPAFLASFEVHSRIKTGYVLAKYTLIFNTNYTESGWGIGWQTGVELVGDIGVRSRISGEAIIIESANPDNVIALITIVNVKGTAGMSYDFDSGPKIEVAYDNAGKAVGKLLR